MTYDHLHAYDITPRDTGCCSLNVSVSDAIIDHARFFSHSFRGNFEQKKDWLKSKSPLVHWQSPLLEFQRSWAILAIT